MKAQALRRSSMWPYMSNKRTMEINPENPIREELRKRVETDKYDKWMKNLVTFLYEAWLSKVEEPNTFMARIHRVLKLGLSMRKNPINIKGYY